jgi:hypothetical protein
MAGRGRSIGVGVFPPDLYCVLRVDHHDIRCRARTPRVTSKTCMSVLVLPVLLPRPVLVAITPTQLLESGSVRGIPEMHAHVCGRACGTIGSAIALIRQRTVFVIGIAIVVTIPASLHAYLIGIEDRMVLTGQGTLYPQICCIAVYLFSKTIGVVDVEEMPLKRISE